MLRLLLSRLGREILRGIRDEIDDARETGEFPLLRARIEAHENLATEWAQKAEAREDKGYHTSKNRSLRRAYTRAVLASKRNATTARGLERIVELLRKEGEP